MSFTRLNRLQIRKRVQHLLRDDGYPSENINEAINRVLTEVNNSGRYRFQETQHNFTLTGGTVSYTFPSNVSFIGDVEVIFQPQTADFKLVPKMDYADALAEGRFKSSGPTPEVYSLLGDGSTLYVDPIPDSTATGKTLRILGYQDITPLLSDISIVGVLPARYHETLLVYGTLAEVAPAVQIRTGDGYVPAAQAFAQSFKRMQEQETWKSNLIPKWRRDERWREAHRIGTTTRVR